MRSGPISGRLSSYWLSRFSVISVVLATPIVGALLVYWVLPAILPGNVEHQAKAGWPAAPVSGDATESSTPEAGDQEAPWGFTVEIPGTQLSKFDLIGSDYFFERRFFKMDVRRPEEEQQEIFSGSVHFFGAEDESTGARLVSESMRGLCYWNMVTNPGRASPFDGYVNPTKWKGTALHDDYRAMVTGFEVMGDYHFSRGLFDDAKLFYREAAELNRKLKSGETLDYKLLKQKLRIREE